MLNYSALASAVILKAHDDLFGENRFFDAKPYRRREKDREDAREFLTKENEELKFWCVVGGLSMKAIVEKTLNQVEETRRGNQGGEVGKVSILPSEDNPSDV